MQKGIKQVRGLIGRPLFYYAIKMIFVFAGIVVISEILIGIKQLLFLPITTLKDTLCLSLRTNLMLEALLL